MTHLRRKLPSKINSKNLQIPRTNTAIPNRGIELTPPQIATERIKAPTLSTTRAQAIQTSFLLGVGAGVDQIEAKHFGNNPTDNKIKEGFFFNVLRSGQRAKELINNG